jgi:hypothetical protein
LTGNVASGAGMAWYAEPETERIELAGDGLTAEEDVLDR